MSSIEVDGLTKHFGTTRAVGPIRFSIGSGEFVSLLGPSGCGKTTTLRMIAGLEQADAGSIRIGDVDMTGVPIERRGVGMVFQSYALFPHLNVFDNVAFGLRLKRHEKEAISQRVSEALNMVGLEPLGGRMPRQLSGGQQQRVALARALAVQPSALLLDEPLSNLDLKLREQMRGEIRQIQRRLGITALYVTHDQGEAMAMSDRIVVMNQGLVEQIGTPREIYERPASIFVARFIGQCTVLEGKLEPADGRAGRFVTRSGVTLELAGQHAEMTVARTYCIVIRPELARILDNATEGGDAATRNILDATVEDATYVGERINLSLRLRQGDLILAAGRVSPGRPLAKPGDRIRFALAPEELSLVETASRTTP